MWYSLWFEAIRVSNMSLEFLDFENWILEFSDNPEAFECAIYNFIVDKFSIKVI